MPSAWIFLLGGVALAAALGVFAWMRARGPRSADRTVERFRDAMQAIAPERRRR